MEVQPPIWPFPAQSWVPWAVSSSTGCQECSCILYLLALRNANHSQREHKDPLPTSIIPEVFLTLPNQVTELHLGMKLLKGKGKSKPQQ